MTRLTITTLAAAGLLFVANPVLAGGASAVSAVGAGGYDLVSYHQGAKPLPGNGNHIVEQDGVTYLFTNQANADEFAGNPEKYLPAYGGFCAYGVAVGKKFVGDPNVWEIVDGRLYLNLDTRIKGIWSKDIAGNLKKAEGAWSRIRDQAPADL
jgi:YHS domain-containing protein